MEELLLELQFFFKTHIKATSDIHSYWLSLKSTIMLFKASEKQLGPYRSTVSKHCRYTLRLMSSFRAFRLEEGGQAEAEHVPWWCGG